MGFQYCNCCVIMNTNEHIYQEKSPPKWRVACCMHSVLHLGLMCIEEKMSEFIKKMRQSYLSQNF